VRLLVPQARAEARIALSNDIVATVRAAFASTSSLCGWAPVFVQSSAEVSLLVMLLTVGLISGTCLHQWQALGKVRS
jgi:hypothetical protein